MWPIRGTDWGARGGSRGSWLNILRAAIATIVVTPISKSRREELLLEKAILVIVKLVSTVWECG